jgi:formylglycine-generating enzyme required for sulfatase activity
LATQALRFANSSDVYIRGFAREIIAREAGAPELVLAPVQVADPVADPDMQVDPTTGVTFMRIPKGEFWMGNDGSDDESPRHCVEVPNDFWLAKYPVTNNQYRRFLESPNCCVKQPDCWNDRRFNQLEQPVVGITWDEAAAFCAWAGGRLPCEIEWEYACRAWTETKYWFGDSEDQLEEYGWYRKNSGGQSHPVGAKPANPWGLHDMHGNVWEWCEDWFEPQAYRVRVERALIEEGEWEPDDLSGLSPQRLAEMVRKLVFPMTVVSARSWTRVLRGGSWFFSADACRSACRDHCKPRDVSSRIGFRVCRGGESVVARRPRD